MAEDRTVDVGHVIVGPYVERKWPFQWLASCSSCSAGIRCNSREDAADWLDRHQHFAASARVIEPTNEANEQAN